MRECIALLERLLSERQALILSLQALETAHRQTVTWKRTAVAREPITETSREAVPGQLRALTATQREVLARLEALLPPASHPIATAAGSVAAEWEGTL